MQPNLSSEEQEFLQHLRSETRQLHDELEAKPLSKKLMSNPLQLTDYITYLQKMHLLHTHYEQHIAPRLTHVFTDIQQRERLSAVNHDLKNLNIKPEENGDPLFDNITDEELPGVMYVLEGSTLGGRVILKQVADSLGFTDEELPGVTQYFQGFGENTGKMWILFLEKFANHAVGSGTQNQIIAGARKAYQAIGSL